MKPLEDSELQTANYKNPSWRFKVGLLLLVTYLPYGFIFFLREPVSYVWVLIKYGAILPGVAIRGLLRFLPADGLELAFVCTGLWLMTIIGCSLRLREGFWPFLFIVSLVSAMFGWTTYVLIKA